MKERSGWWSLGLIAFGVALLVAPNTLGAAEKTVQTYPEVKIIDVTLRNRPVMVSLIASDGAVVKQSEILPGGQEEGKTWSGDKLWFVPPGCYDLRFEGEGMVTVVKRGVTFSPLEKDPPRYFAVMQPGQGARVIEYASAGLPREEIAERLMKLEAAVAELKNK